MTPLRTRLRRPADVLRRFVRGTRAGTGITAAAVTVMTVGGGALIVDHVWLYDQRDVLKTAAEAAAIAATLEIDRRLTRDPDMSDADLEAALEPIARRYVEINLGHLPRERLAQARNTLEIALDLERARRTVGVEAKADLGGTLFSRHLPLLGGHEGPDAVRVKAGVATESSPVEVVLAIDVTGSMRLSLGGRIGTMGGKSRIDTVKRAAKHLVDILEPDAYRRVAVGVVPWHVNVRLDARTAEKWARKGWARYPARRTYPVPYYCFDNGCTVDPVVDRLPASPPREWLGCFDGHRVYKRTSSVPAPTATALFEPPSAAPFAQSYFPPSYGDAYHELDRSTLPELAIHNYLAHNPDRYQQRYCASDQPALLPLGTDAAAVKSAVDALSLYRGSGGRTFSTLGVLWAQRMLEPRWKKVWGGDVHPANPRKPGYAHLRKAIVLLTDGGDSYCEPPSHSGAYNYTCEGTPLAVSRIEACKAAKARGTEIFVIAALTPDFSAPISDKLRACSSEDDRKYPRGTRRPGATYTFLSSATTADLEAAFANIANQLRTVRRVY